MRFPIVHQCGMQTQRYTVTSASPFRLYLSKQWVTHFIYVVEVIDEDPKAQGGGMVEANKLPWTTPALLIRKENGKFQFICHYQGLNKDTTPEFPPVPNVDNIVYPTVHSKTSTKTDLFDAFFQTLIYEPHYMSCGR